MSGVALLTGAELSAKGSSLIRMIAAPVGFRPWAAGVVISPKLKLRKKRIGIHTALPTICGEVNAARCRTQRVANFIRCNGRQFL